MQCIWGRMNRLMVGVSSSWSTMIHNYTVLGKNASGNFAVFRVISLQWEYKNFHYNFTHICDLPSNTISLRCPHRGCPIKIDRFIVVSFGDHFVFQFSSRSHQLSSHNFPTNPTRYPETGWKYSVVLKRRYFKMSLEFNQYRIPHPSWLSGLELLLIQQRTIKWISKWLDGWSSIILMNYGWYANTCTLSVCVNCKYPSN